jgi:uncharacterized DUF497 family protein
VDELQFQFEWDVRKAAANVRKHGVLFELACTVFSDPRILSIADVEHSESEERWFAIGSASDGSLVSIVYTWTLDPSATKIRLISARKATKNETRQYEENL